MEGKRKTSKGFSPEVRARAVRMAQEHQGERASQWAAMSSIAAKAEVIHRRGPWRSFEAVECATPEWVDWFNNNRLLEPIGNIPPAEAEPRHCAQADGCPMAA
jgi:transposase InsO family protein